MIVLGLHTGHDGAAALFNDGKLIAYCKEERVTRIKSDGRHLHLRCIDEVFTIAGLSRSDVDVACLSRMMVPYDFFRKTTPSLKMLIKRLRGKRSHGIAVEMMKQREPDESKILDLDALRKSLGLRDDAKVTFANHHYAHILGAFQFTTWPKDALYVSADGGGDGAQYAAYAWDGQQLQCLYGGEETLFQRPQNTAASIGSAYSAVTKFLGFRPNRHEGKITGLAAFGKPTLASAMEETFILNDDGSIESKFQGSDQWDQWMQGHAKSMSREDLAASVQVATENVMTAWVEKLRALSPAKYIGMTGGVFSNVRLNQKVGELPGVEQVFVFPAMGDEGLPLGNCSHVMIEANGITSLNRYELSDVYFGRPYTGEQLLEAGRAKGLKIDQPADIPQATARRLAQGLVGAIFSQRMEMGPRALGARTILASPIDRGLNDSLNDRLDRTEFMPFAPYVLDVDAEEVFVINDTNRAACRFMTITTDVRDGFQSTIPAVVHVDGTARPQIIERGTNPLYYDILKAFKEETGIRCLVNTSFNAHEEPIINTPAEAVTALVDKRIDFLVCEAGLVSVE